jgi:23S rRNA (adenine2030-N6)-methyltransferase
MFAYRHAFHAGNHADVLKHVVLVALLAHLNAKEKGWRYVDTHAGAGGYSLEGRYAQKKSEFEQGVARVLARDDAPPIVADYLTLVRRFNPPGSLEQYPGSPAIAQMLMRPQDQLRLSELHPTDHRILAAYLGKASGVQVANVDGFEALKAHLPPPTRRGLVLIDPSYEGQRGAGQYARVVAALRDALQRFADGIYMVWYPRVARVEATQLPRRLRALAPKGWLDARLEVQKAQGGFGLAGSGVFVINPPHTLHAQLQQALPWLAEALAQHDKSTWSLEQHAA